MRITCILLLGVLLAAWPGLGGTAPAAADPPQALDDQLTDLTTDQVLTDGRGEAEEAIADLRAEADYLLFAVFVDSFDGMAFDQWADETARMSQLGDRDLLL
ncbi:MAG TPA: TPM domain-containing protein, partial [Beutenbergiaceae bacterium]|nr:TPM domain-containing protein [Beutenbergiaceae bacterium]